MTQSDNVTRSGVPLFVRPDLVRLVAPNPSPMTYQGTNSYILGADHLAVIDPGPSSDQHLNALMATIADRPVSHIFVTHSHLDHSPLARPLSERTGAAIHAFGPSSAGRSSIMLSLSKDGLLGGGEGIDHEFQPDVILQDGDEILGDGWTLKALHTPGHIGNHLCFQCNDIIFTGDHVMGWSSSLVSPPHGDLTDFMASCKKLRGIHATTYYPGHGEAVTDPAGRLDWLIKHRKAREAQIIDALQLGHKTLPNITTAVYHDLANNLIPVAERNVLSHLIDLFSRNIIAANPMLSTTADFHLKARDKSNVH